MSTTDPTPTADEHGQISLPLAEDRTASRPPLAVPAVRSLSRQALLVGIAAATVLWGTWATHAILTIEHSSPRIVKVELADLIREYVQVEARSGASPEQITAQTGDFLKTLSAAVGARARHGEIVLLSNAVVDGAVPDITGEVRQEVYSHIAKPQTGPGPSLSPQMQTFFQQNGAAGGNGK